MTRVLTINELQKLIPETLKLEGQNFPDMKILLTSIINLVEKSGKWMFVQYIQAKPSLFVIREVSISQNIENKSERAVTQASDFLKEAYTNTKETVKEEVSKLKNSETKLSEQVLEEKTSEDMQKLSPSTSKLFTENKMPWH